MDKEILFFKYLIFYFQYVIVLIKNCWEYTEISYILKSKINISIKKHNYNKVCRYNKFSLFILKCRPLIVKKTQ